MIWHEAESRQGKTVERNKAFVATLKQPGGADQAFANGDAVITNARR